MKTLILCFSILVIAVTNLSAQILSDNHEEHHHKNDLGVANTIVYFVNEKTVAYGLHLHYIYNFPETKFGLGAGYERVFDEHKHNMIGIVGSYRPIEHWSVNLSPGITFEDVEPSKLDFALHIESSYDFEIKEFHIGPVVEFAYHPEDYHLSIGLHLGYGF